MSGSSAAARDIKSVLDTKPVKFQIRTGGAKYECMIHSDRASYERKRPARAGSADSVTSSGSSTSSLSK